MSRTADSMGMPDDLLAAEHALGVLSAPERRVAERRMRDDPAFERAVEGWNDRLAPMLAAIDPAEPSAELWHAIEAQLPRGVRLGIPPGARRGVAPWWRAAAIASGGLLAASLVAVALLLPAAPPPSQLLAARVSASDGLPLFTAVVDPGTGQATLVPLALSVEAGRVPELWFIPAGGAPISLGLLRGGEPLRVDLGGRNLPDITRAGGALAVSVEPEGGSPTGAPTGPVIGQGALDAV